jgi:large repetitive protein
MLQPFIAKFRIEFFVLRFVVAAALSLLPTYLPGQTVPLPVSTALATTSSTDSQNITLSGLAAAAGSAQTDGTTVYFLNAVSASACDANARIDSTPVPSGAITPFVTSATPLEAAQPSTAPTSICGSPVLSGSALFVSASYAPTPSTKRSGIFRFSTAGGPGADVLATGDVIAGAGTVTAVGSGVADGTDGVFIPFTTATGSYLYASATEAVTAPATSYCNGVSIVSAIPAPGQTDGTLFPALVAATDIASGKAVTVVTANTTKPSADCHDVVYDQLTATTVITPVTAAVSNNVIYLSGTSPAAGIYTLSAGALTRIFANSPPEILPIPTSLGYPITAYFPSTEFTVAGPYLLFEGLLDRFNWNGIPESQPTLVGVAQALYSVYLPTGNIRLVAQATSIPAANVAPHAGSLTASGVAAYESVSGSSTTLSALSVAGIPSATKLSAPATALSGVPVTLSATVTPYVLGSAMASGTVTFLDGTVTLGTVIPDSTGAASLPATFTTGIHSITAAYSGDATFLASTSAVAKLQTGVTTVTTLVSSPAIILPGAQVTLTAHLTPSQVLPSGAPTGSVAFVCNGSTTTGILTAGSGDLVASTACTAPASVGSLYPTASYSSDATYSASTGTETITIGYASAIQLTASSSTVGVGGSSSLTATVTNTTAGATNVIPAGTVTFSCPGVGAVTAAVDARGVAAVNCSFPTAGPTSVAAAFSGPQYFSSYVTATVQVGPGSFFLRSGTVTNTIAAGGTASYIFGIEAYGDFPSSVALSCSGLPAGASCSFSPASVTPGADGNVVMSTVSITTTAAVASLEQPYPSRLTVRGSWMAMLFPFLLLSGFCRKRSPRLMLLLVLLCGTISLTGCAGATPKNSSPSISATPSGTYNVTITGTSGTLANSEAIVLVVR